MCVCVYVLDMCILGNNMDQYWQLIQEPDDCSKRLVSGIYCAVGIAALTIAKNFRA